MALESQGSGTLRDRRSNTDVRYTISKETDYNGKPKGICIYWQQTNGFTPGYYQIEIYNKGFLAGKGTFVLT